MASTKSHHHHNHPLHNFSSLSQLKWTKHPRNHRSSSTTEPPLISSGFSEGSGSDSSLMNNKKSQLEKLRNCPKILIKLPPKEKKDSGEDQIENQGLDDQEEKVPKTWNFRPRKQFLDYNGKVFKNSAPPPAAAVPEIGGDKPETEKKDKNKGFFTISLSKEEIEADVFALIGSKPSRRPKKRSRTTQKQLDCLFPGVWLQSITADSYKVSYNHGKVKA